MYANSEIYAYHTLLFKLETTARTAKAYVGIRIIWKTPCKCLGVKWNQAESLQGCGTLKSNGMTRSETQEEEGRDAKHVLKLAQLRWTGHECYECQRKFRWIITEGKRPQCDQNKNLRTHPQSLTEGVIQNSAKGRTI